MSAPKPRTDFRTLFAEMRREFATKAQFDERVGQMNATYTATAELEAWVDKMRAEIRQMRAEYATRAQLDERTQQLMTGIESVRSELDERTQQLMTGIESVRSELEAKIARLPTEEDLARHVKTMTSTVLAVVGVVDEKYADLPKRVTALEERG